VRSFDAIEALARRVLDSASDPDASDALAELVEAVTPYLLWVRRRFEFFHIPVSETREVIIPSATHEAIALAGARSVPFVSVVRNVFRDHCREWSQHHRDLQLDELEAVLAPRPLATRPDRRSAEAQGPVTPELVGAVMEALAHESPACQVLVQMHTRGATDAEIAIALDCDPTDCKNERVRNIRHMRDYLRAHHTTPVPSVE
jgi:hypothetical protein